MDITKFSADTRRRLIRYADAVREYELNSYKGNLDQCAAGVIQEKIDACKDLEQCPEPELKDLVYRIQFERIDEAYSISALATKQADDEAITAKEELVRLGHILRS